MLIIAPGQEASYECIFNFPSFEGMLSFSLESPHLGSSNEYTQYTIFNTKKKITLNYPKSAAIGYFPRDSKTSSKQPW